MHKNSKETASNGIFKRKSDYYNYTKLSMIWEFTGREEQYTDKSCIQRSLLSKHSEASFIYNKILWVVTIQHNMMLYQSFL